MEYLVAIINFIAFMALVYQLRAQRAQIKFMREWSVGQNKIVAEQDSLNDAFLRNINRMDKEIDVCETAIETINDEMES